MIRRPPRSTLFPTRRSSDLSPELQQLRGYLREPAALAAGSRKRSEEHTSELQSPYDLVCRLLLEKKNPRSLVLMLYVVYIYERYYILVLERNRGYLPCLLVW